MSLLVGSAKCDSYNRDDVYIAVKKAIDAAGGLPDINGKKVLLKPNLLAEADDGIERGVCTNPAIVYAVGKIILESGGILSITDSPGGGVPNTPAGIKKTYQGCGVDVVAEKLGVKLSYDLGYSHMKNPSGKKVKSFPIINAAFDADVIISIPKLKTHMFTAYTGAVKNTFGLIPGKTKSAFHPMFPNPQVFSEMLVDLNETIKPSFVVMDAISIMEGDGPSGGRPRKLGYILASPSVYAVDVVGQKLIGLEPTEIATTRAACNRNLLSLPAITVSGDDVEPVDDILMPSTYTNYVGDDKKAWYIKYPRRYLNRCITTITPNGMPVPYIAINSCTACKKCIESCEGAAIQMDYGRISVNHRKCQHCNTCYVICPEKAITMLPPKSVLSYRKLISSYPKLKTEKCVACGKCARICPMDAVTFVNKKAVFDIKTCIRCYCCHEMCAYDAIELQEAPIMRMIHRRK